jgi:hypothetical protein
MTEALSGSGSAADIFLVPEKRHIWVKGQGQRPDDFNIVLD